MSGRITINPQSPHTAEIAAAAEAAGFDMTGTMSEELKAECVTAFEAAAVRNEMARIRALFVKSPDDAEDLITYAKEVVRLRTHTEATEPGEAEVERLIHEFRRLPLEADAGCDKLTDSEWRTVARAAIAALRSTTPASDGGDK